MDRLEVTRHVAARMRQLRQQRGWSALQLADACAHEGLASLTRSTIAKIESGVRQSVTAEEVAVLARIFGVTPTDFLPTPAADPLPTLRNDRLSGRRRAPGSISPEVRSEFARDVDRVSYNYYFRRLAEITQVSSDHDRALRHNRMTHSLKVAQVGRRLVQYLINDRSNARGLEVAGGIDPDVVAAAGLLHDIGHPPFGHIGEQELDQWAKRRGLVDGYEGNAQTLRIILSLTVHQAGPEGLFGLDLTRAVTAACVKYPWSSKEAGEIQKTKWGYYKPEADIFEKFITPILPRPGTATLEAEIMDWADDITYAVHDLQDFYTDGIIPLHDLRHSYSHASNNYAPINYREFADFWRYVTAKSAIDLPSGVACSEFQKYATRFPGDRYRGGREEDAQLGALASQIVTDASKATAITDDGRLHIDKKMKAVINVLKQATWYYVIDHPDLVATQIGQRARIAEVCQKLFEWVESCFRQREDGRMLTIDEQWTRKNSLPVRLREFTEQLLAENSGRGAYENRNHCYARAVVDYVASMTEVDFDRLGKKLYMVHGYEKYGKDGG